MEEVDVEPVDFRHELRQRIELCFDLAPVVVVTPIADERLNPGCLDTLGLIIDSLCVRPPRRMDALTKVGQLCFRNVDREWTD